MVLQVAAALAIPAVLEAVKTGLEQLDHPAAQGARAAISALQEAAQKGLIPEGQLAAANAHIEKMAQIMGETERTTLSEVNASLRAEVAASDPYVRRMRPTFGYMMAVTWGAQMLALAYVIITDPIHAGDVLTAMSSLGTIWAVALSVLGLYVYGRSQEKMKSDAF